MKQIKWVNGVSNVSLLELISRRVESYPLFSQTLLSRFRKIQHWENNFIIEMMGFIICSQKNKKTHKDITVKWLPVKTKRTGLKKVAKDELVKSVGVFQFRKKKVNSVQGELIQGCFPKRFVRAWVAACWTVHWKVLCQCFFVFSSFTWNT